MSDAFKCDKCGEFNQGTGTDMRYGAYVGTSGFQSNYDFVETAELCERCKEDLDGLVRDYMGGFDG